MKSRMLGFVMCASLVAVTVFSVTSAAKDQENHARTTEIHGGVEYQQKPQPASQADVVSILDIERVKKEAALSNELNILKEKNLLMGEFQSTLLSTVIWSLGVAVSIVLVLVTASFFTNFKVHERDIQRIQDDYAAKLEVLNSDVNSKLAKVSKEIDIRHEARSQQDLDRMLSQATELRSQFEKVRVLLEEKLTEATRSAVRAEVQADKLKEDHLGIVSDISRLEINVWELKKIPGNVLIASIEGLNAAMKNSDEWSIDDFTAKIRQVIEEHFVTTQRPLSEFHVDFLTKSKTDLSKSRPEHAAEISAMLATCKHEEKGKS